MNTDENYLDIVDELNNNLTDKATNEGYSFSYVSNGWFHGIKFNDDFIWDSENDTREYHGEETDTYEPLLDCIKREFNNYVNLIKTCRFDIPDSDNVEGHDAVGLIIDDLTSRKGIGNEWEAIDVDTQDEIFQHWVTIVEKHN